MVAVGYPVIENHFSLIPDGRPADSSHSINCQCSFKAGRSRPPGHSRPSFAGPAAAYSVLSEHGFKSVYRMYTSSHI